MDDSPQPNPFNNGSHSSSSSPPLLPSTATPQGTPVSEFLNSLSSINSVNVVRLTPVSVAENPSPVSLVTPQRRNTGHLRRYEPNTLPNTSQSVPCINNQLQIVHSTSPNIFDISSSQFGEILLSPFSNGSMLSDMVVQNVPLISPDLTYAPGNEDNVYRHGNRRLLRYAYAGASSSIFRGPSHGTTSNGGFANVETESYRSQPEPVNSSQMASTSTNPFGSNQLGGYRSSPQRTPMHETGGNGLANGSHITSFLASDRKAYSNMNDDQQESIATCHSDKLSKLLPYLNFQRFEDKEVPCFRSMSTTTSVDIDRAQPICQVNPKRKRKQDIINSNEDKPQCKCKNSKCLKLYCECFSTGSYCGKSCGCQNCNNTTDDDDSIHEARRTVLSRNPQAFSSKEGKNQGLRDNKGCNCKKSTCSKKYCHCYQKGVGCSTECRCEGCENSFGTKAEAANKERAKNPGSPSNENLDYTNQFSSGGGPSFHPSSVVGMNNDNDTPLIHPCSVDTNNSATQPFHIEPASLIGEHASIPRSQLTPGILLQQLLHGSSSNWYCSFPGYFGHPPGVPEEISITSTPDVLSPQQLPSNGTHSTADCPLDSQSMPPFPPFSQ